LIFVVVDFGFFFFLPNSIVVVIFDRFFLRQSPPPGPTATTLRPWGRGVAWGRHGLDYCVFDGFRARLRRFLIVVDFGFGVLINSSFVSRRVHLSDGTRGWVVAWGRQGLF
jgi:hypothetical protein